MKKLIAAVALMACGAAQADVGPIYISYPGYCNIKEIYLNPYGDVYGYEKGCSASYGAPFFGTMDGASGNIYVSTPDGGVCMHVYRADGTLKGGCTNGQAYRYGETIRYFVTSSMPRSLAKSTDKEKDELPSIGH